MYGALWFSEFWFGSGWFGGAVPLVVWMPTIPEPHDWVEQPAPDSPFAEIAPETFVWTNQDLS